MNQYLNQLTTVIEQYHTLGYWAAFAAALLETALVVGLLLPGSTLLLLLGALAAGGQLSFAGVLWFAVAGAIIGDNFNYWMGKRYGSRWVREGLGSIGPEHFVKAQRFFERYGAASVFLGRFIPSVKEFAPVVAGTVGMRRPTFMFWNVLGAVGWGLQWVGAGYLFGHSFKLAQTWMSRFGLAVVLLLALGGVLWWLQRLALRQGRKLWRVAASLADSLREALQHNPWVRHWKRRYPAASRFMAKRLDRTRFFGLPWTLMVLGGTYLLALFAGVVEDVLTADAIVSTDHAAAQLVAALRPQSWVAPLAAFTQLGSASVVGALMLVCAVWLVGSNRALAVVGLLVSVLGSTLFGQLAKLAFQRPRPAEAVLLETSHAFPSGHATAAVAFYAFVGYLAIRQSNAWPARVRLFFGTALFVLLLGFSRILLGVHYLSDVWAGYLVGALWLIVGVSVNEWLTTRGRLAWHTPMPSMRRWGIRGVVLAGSIGVLVSLPINSTPYKNPQEAQPVALDQPLAQVLQEGPPRFSTTALGAPEQPLGIALLVDDESALRMKMQSAGWHEADPPALSRVLRLARDGADDSTAPLAPVFWNQRMNELAFVRHRAEASGHSKETLRLWATAWRLGSARVFVGVAREQVDTRWRLLHRSLPDVDAVADDVVASLQGSSANVTTCRIQWVAPMTGSYLMGEPFFTRGELRLVNVATQPVSNGVGVCATNGPH